MHLHLGHTTNSETRHAEYQRNFQRPMMLLYAHFPPKRITCLHHCYYRRVARGDHSRRIFWTKEIDATLWNGRYHQPSQGGRKRTTRTMRDMINRSGYLFSPIARVTSPSNKHQVPPYHYLSLDVVPFRDSSTGDSFFFT